MRSDDSRIAGRSAHRTRVQRRSELSGVMTTCSERHKSQRRQLHAPSSQACPQWRIASEARPAGDRSRRKRASVSSGDAHPMSHIRCPFACRPGNVCRGVYLCSLHRTAWVVGQTLRTTFADCRASSQSAFYVSLSRSSSSDSRQTTDKQQTIQTEPTCICNCSHSFRIA